MRGISYAIAEIAVFMIAATLVGYFMGRLAGPARRARQLLAVHRATEERLRSATVAAQRSERHALLLSEDATVAHERIAELEAELERRAEVPPPTAGEEAAATSPDEETAGLFAEIERQRAVIEALEHVAADAGDLEEILRHRNERIAMLEAALVAADEAEQPELAITFSATSEGSGRYADALLDIEVMP